jgi:hypothetical protein
MFDIVHEVKNSFLLPKRKKPEDDGQVGSVGLVDDLMQVGRRTSPEESLDRIQENSCAIDSHAHCSNTPYPVLTHTFLPKTRTN